MMTTIFLHEKTDIEQLFRDNVFLHIYSIGDLDDFYWPYTTWYATKIATEIKAIALLYIGQSLPTLLALSENQEDMRYLLKSILHLLPQTFYAHLSPGVETVLSKTHHLDSHGGHLKMALLQESMVNTFDCPDTFALGHDDVQEVVDFYRKSYPGNWFDPRMLETGQYYGIRKGEDIISIAGIHVYSTEYKVAALGNIATSPLYRKKGYARQVTAKTCQSLLKKVNHIGLNVKADNEAAISCYRSLGFEAIASYGEYSARKK